MKLMNVLILSTLCMFRGFGQLNSDMRVRIAQIDSYLVALSKERNYSGGLLIIKDGTTLIKKGYGFADKEKRILFSASTLASMGSISKAFTAAAILKLAEQKKLSLNDPLKKYFTAVPPDKADITLHQLLTHSAGFHEFLSKDGGDYEKIDKNEFLSRAFSEPLSFEPGKKSVYTNVGMSILAIIIEQVTNTDYEHYLRKYLFEPIGIQGIGYQYPPTMGNTVAIGYQNGVSWGTHLSHFAQVGGGPYWNLKGNGGLEASLQDMEKWINAITYCKILSKSTTDKMFTAHIKEDGAEGDFYFGYGCNISHSRRNTKMINNGGSNGVYYARLVRLPEEGVVFYMVTNESSINTSMVLPNVTQLYFSGKIEQDAIALKPRFENEQSKKIYDILDTPADMDLSSALSKANIHVEDDMILLEVGQALIEERKFSKALSLYKFYTSAFPDIVVAWNDLGDVYQSIGKKEEAIKCYTQALKLRPGNPRATEALKKLE